MVAVEGPPLGRYSPPVFLSLSWPRLPTPAYSYPGPPLVWATGTPGGAPPLHCGVGTPSRHHPPVLVPHRPSTFALLPPIPSDHPLALSPLLTLTCAPPRSPPPAPCPPLPQYWARCCQSGLPQSGLHSLPLPLSLTAKSCSVRGGVPRPLRDRLRVPPVRTATPPSRPCSVPGRPAPTRTGLSGRLLSSTNQSQQQTSPH